jgi:dipeptidyl aminopeptidase/acylaminoacyl peptidase
MTPFACQTADGVRIVGALFLAADASRGWLVLAHGLPAAVPPPPDPHDEGYAGLARQFTSLGWNVAIFNFRGTGESGGHLEVDLWPFDLGAVLDYLDASPHRQARYTVVGFSAGGAAAILRSRDDARIGRLITVAAPADYSFLPLGTDADHWFNLYRELGMIRAGYAGTPAAWAARFGRMLAREAIRESRASQITVLHGTADDVVPPWHADALVEAAGARARKVALPGLGHQLRRDPRAIAALHEALT